MSRKVEDQARWLADQFADIRREVRGVKGQGDLAYSSIEDGAIVEKDLDGNLVGSVGKQEDGSHVQVAYTGPIPAAPTVPQLTAVPGVVEVRWNGKFDGDQVSAMDFKHVAVHVSVTPVVDVTPSSQVATIRGELGDVATVTATPGLLYVALVAWSVAGKSSAPSPVALVIVPAPADGDAIGERLDELDTKYDGVITDAGQLGSRLDAAEDDLVAAAGRLSTAESELVDAFGQISTVDGKAADAQTAADEALKRAKDAERLLTNRLANPEFEQGLDFWHQEPAGTWTIRDMGPPFEAIAVGAPVEGGSTRLWNIGSKDIDQTYTEGATLIVVRDGLYRFSINGIFGHGGRAFIRVFSGSDGSFLREVFTPILHNEAGVATAALQIQAVGDDVIVCGVDIPYTGVGTGLYFIDAALVDVTEIAAIDAAAAEAQARADEAKAAAGVADGKATTAATAAATAQGKADTAKTAADQAASDALAAAGIANSKGKTLIQSAAPAAADRNTVTLWIDTTGGANTPKRWVSGTTWAAVTDKAATDAATSAAAAQSAAAAADAKAVAAKLAADAANAELATVPAKIETAKQAAIDAAALVAQAKANAAESAAKTAAATDAEAKADAAQAAAIAAAKTASDLSAAGAKSEAIAAATADAKTKADAAQAAAIAAAAADATAKAAQAKTDATTVAANDATAKANTAKADAIAAAALDATAKAGQAKTDAIASATTMTNGIGKNLSSTAIPTTFNTAPQGSIWRRTDGSGRIIGVWEQTGAGVAGTWTPRLITSETIDNLDVGKLSASGAVINTLVSQKIAAAVGVFLELDVGQLRVTGSSTMAEAVIAKLWADVVMSRKITTQMLAVGSFDNLIAEPDFTNGGASWPLSSSRQIIAGQGRSGGPVFRMTGVGAINSAYNAPSEFPVAGETSWRIVAWVRSSVAVASNVYTIFARTKASGGALTYPAIDPVTPALFAGVWTKVTGVITAAESAVTASFALSLRANFPSGATLDFDFVSATRMNSGELIVDGAIDGKIIRGVEIIGGTITGGWVTTVPASNGVTASLGMVGEPGFQQYPGIGFNQGPAVKRPAGMVSRYGDDIVIQSREVVGGDNFASLTLEPDVDGLGHAELWSTDRVDLVGPKTTIIATTYIRLKTAGAVDFANIDGNRGDLTNVGTINGTPAPSADIPWARVPLQNSFTHYVEGVKWDGLRFTRRNRTLHINGPVTRATSWGAGQVIGTLAAAYRPTWRIKGDGIEVDPTGLIILIAAGSGTIAVSATAPLG